VHQEHTDTVSVKNLYRLQWTQCQAMKINVKNVTRKSTCGLPPPYNSHFCILILQHMSRLS